MEQKYGKQEMFEWLKAFITENYWYSYPVPQQASSIFTTICMIWNIDADTTECDSMLHELWECVAVSENLDDYEVADYKEFENMMLHLIV